jgi:phospholipid/cholesterol/gamma-HCH transport system ATP-binding protein
MISVENVCKSFDDKPVLRDVSVHIREGETHAVIGRSGSGKSVLLKHIIGLLKPESGRIVVDGVDIGTLKEAELRKLRRRFGVLFQGGALFDSMSAIENVAFPLKKFSSLTGSQVVARALECLDLVQLPDAAPKKPSELSGGQQKRVALARAIALEPKYILYDEPTSGLDPQTSNTIDLLISDLADRLGVTSIVISHDIHSVLRVADRASFLFQGEMRWTGTIPEMHSSDDEELLAFVKANEYVIGQHRGSAPALSHPQ